MLTAIEADIGLWGRGKVVIAVDVVVGDVVDAVIVVVNAIQLIKGYIANNLELRDFAVVQAGRSDELPKMEVVCVDVEF